MTWNVIVARPAERAFRKMQGMDTKRVLAALQDMAEEPFQGDVVALQGVHKGSFRRRVGQWRIFFDVDTERNTVSVTNILRRSSTTY